MKLKPKGRAVKVSMLSLAMALGLSACSNDYTVAYVYMTTSGTLPHGLINAYQVDYQSGYLRPLADSPVDAGGRDTVAIAVAPSNLFLYTINNFDSDVTEFAIGTDGKLYPENTYNIAGSLPTAAAIDAAGKFLYVTFTYQNNADGSQLYSLANPGPGGVSVFPINSDNTLGKPFTVNAGRNPIGIATSPVQIPAGVSGCSATAGAFCTAVFVIEKDASTSANLLGFAENSATGALTPMPGTIINPAPGNFASTGYASGSNPSGILVDKTGTHLYVTDQTLNQVAMFSIPAATGVPGLAATAPTDAGPMGMAFDLTGKYLYVTAYTANVLDLFTVGTGGQATRLASSNVQTGTGPTCATVIGAPSNANPSHGEYLYTSNALSNNLTGVQVNQQDGSVDLLQGTPFSGSVLPTCAVTVPALPLR